MFDVTNSTNSQVLFISFHFQLQQKTEYFLATQPKRNFYFSIVIEWNHTVSYKQNRLIQFRFHKGCYTYFH